MALAQTAMLRETGDVDKRLAEMELTRQGLLTARDIALQEAANATGFHPANAAGTFSYHHGTWALRNEFVGESWVEDRVDGIEAIRNDRLKIKIAFCNVDVACHDMKEPKPRSKKGAGAERAANGGLFPDLPSYAPEPTGEFALYYLMVDEDGAAELSRPIVKGGTFEGMVERIYLSRGGEEEDAAVRKGDTSPVDGFDPQVVRK